MLNRFSKFSALVPVVAGVGVAVLAASSGQAGQASGTLRCDIQATTSNGMVTILGVVQSGQAISGSYEFSVVSKGPAGKSNLNQGGGFSAKANAATPVGQVNVMSAGATYDVTFRVSAGGQTVDCKERLSGLA